MLYEAVIVLIILLLVFPFLSTVYETSGPTGPRSLIFLIKETYSIRGLYLNERHLIEETPSAIIRRIEAYHAIYEENHIDSQCDVVSEVICFSEADYNTDFHKSQEPSAIFIYYLLSIYIPED